MAAPGVGVQARRQVPVPVVVRSVLLLAWLAILANSFTQAREVTVNELYRDLADGSVTAIEVERAASVPGGQVQGSFGLRWEGGLLDSFTRYEYASAAGVDEAADLLDQARADGVPVRVVPVGYSSTEMVTPDGWLQTTFGPWVVLLGLLAVGLCWVTLITSPQPWLATKWAWFWLLAAMPVLWIAFLALEPRPLRTSLRLAAAGRGVPGRPRVLLGGREQRLTAGWALLIAWVASALLASTGLPVFSAWH